MNGSVRAIIVSLVVIATCSACSGASNRAPEAQPSGPAQIQLDVVEEHARQFDEDLALRVAGSQQEFAASAYILAHLQRAGYVARLEPVPVSDLVRSTDVIAVRPGDEQPTVVVGVAYDNAPGAAPSGASLGLFLELARSLVIAQPQHSTWFVALGAQSTALQGGSLGTKALARLLSEEETAPLIVLIGPASNAIVIGGSASEELSDYAMTVGAIAQFDHAPPVLPRRTERLFGRDDVRYATVEGPPDRIGPLLLGFLEERGS